MVNEKGGETVSEDADGDFYSMVFADAVNKEPRFASSNKADADDGGEETQAFKPRRRRDRQRPNPFMREISQQTQKGERQRQNWLERKKMREDIELKREKRKKASKKLRARTSRGQPVMQMQIEHLLKKLV